MGSAEAGKKHIKAGVALIEWSGLARWDTAQRRLKVADNPSAFAKQLQSAIKGNLTLLANPCGVLT